jgi:hypothetical protein
MNSSHFLLNFWVFNWKLICTRHEFNSNNFVLLHRIFWWEDWVSKQKNKKTLLTNTRTSVESLYRAVDISGVQFWCFLLITIKFLKSLARNFQTFQSGTRRTSMFWAKVLCREINSQRAFSANEGSPPCTFYVVVPTLNVHDLIRLEAVKCYQISTACIDNIFLLSETIHLCMQTTAWTSLVCMFKFCNCFLLQILAGPAGQSGRFYLIHF